MLQDTGNEAEINPETTIHKDPEMISTASEQETKQFIGNEPPLSTLKSRSEQSTHNFWYLFTIARNTAWMSALVLVQIILTCLSINFNARS